MPRYASSDIIPDHFMPLDRAERLQYAVLVELRAIAGPTGPSPDEVAVDMDAIIAHTPSPSPAAPRRDADSPASRADAAPSYPPHPRVPQGPPPKRKP